MFGVETFSKFETETLSKLIKNSKNFDKVRNFVKVELKEPKNSVKVQNFDKGGRVDLIHGDTQNSQHLQKTQ